LVEGNVAAAIIDARPAVVPALAALVALGVVLAVLAVRPSRWLKQTQTLKQKQKQKQKQVYSFSRRQSIVLELSNVSSLLCAQAFLLPSSSCTALSF